jgi:hypothetical protein
MRTASLVSLLGFVTLIVATFCPMLRPFHLFNMNVYALNQPYGMVITLSGVIGVLCTVLNQTKISRIAAWASLVLVALLFTAAQLKVKASFSFIPFSGINGYLTRQIAFKWGWYVLFAGALLGVSGALSSGRRLYDQGR